MKKMWKKAKNFGNAVARKAKGLVAAGAGIIGGLTMAKSAHAAVDLTGVTVDTATPEALAATVLAGLGVLWGIRKLVKLINRS